MTVMLLVHNRSAIPVFDKPLRDLGKEKSLVLERSTLNGTFRGVCDYRACLFHGSTADRAIAAPKNCFKTRHPSGRDALATNQFPKGF